MKPERQKSGRVIWVTEWDSTGSACPHGVPIPYRWYNETENDEESSEPEYGSYECEKCEAVRQQMIEAARRGDWETVDALRSRTGYSL